MSTETSNNVVQQLHWLYHNCRSNFSTWPNHNLFALSSVNASAFFIAKQPTRAFDLIRQSTGEHAMWRAEVTNISARKPTSHRVTAGWRTAKMSQPIRFARRQRSMATDGCWTAALTSFKISARDFWSARDVANSPKINLKPNLKRGETRLLLLFDCDQWSIV